jgi:hypothetical protein
MKLQLDDARRILAEGEADFALLVEAAAAISSDPRATPADLDACLALGGLPAEFARSRPQLRVALLEDDPRRIEALCECLNGGWPGCRIDRFTDAPSMIRWLRENVGAVDIICLDHDLNDFRDADGELEPAGTGREVVDELVKLAPTCPVLIHSSNAPAASGMLFALRDAGWPVRAIAPYDDLAWVEGAWSGEFRALLHARESAVKAPRAPLPATPSKRVG